MIDIDEIERLAKGGSGMLMKCSDILALIAEVRGKRWRTNDRDVPRWLLSRHRSPMDISRTDRACCETESAATDETSSAGKAGGEGAGGGERRDA